MAQPTAVASIWSQQIISTSDIDKPENLNVLFRRYGDQGLGFFRIIESMGWKLPTAQELYGHWEEDFIHETFNSRNAVGAPGPGNNILITLDSTNLNANNQFKVFFTSNLIPEFKNIKLHVSRSIIELINKQRKILV